MACTLASTPLPWTPHGHRETGGRSLKAVLGRFRRAIRWRRRILCGRSRANLRESWWRLLVILRLQRTAYHGRRVDLVHPRTFNDKCHWRMLYDRRPLLQLCCDKVAVRDYVARRVGPEHLIPLLGIYERPEDIPWSELEPPYVVKASHGSAWVLVVKDRADVDPERFDAAVRRWLATNYYYYRREWFYKHVPRRIIIERFIGVEGAVPVDYKFWCYAGVPQAIWVISDRFTDPGYSTRWLSPSWSDLGFTTVGHPSGPDTPPPAKLDEMLRVASTLSRDFDFVRVDLYCPGEQVYFGELTMAPLAGQNDFSPPEADLWLGGFWQLPRKRDVRRRTPLPADLLVDR